MKILFAIAVVSFAALVWAALAILRHVRRNSARAAARPAADAEMTEAIDLRLLELSRARANPDNAPASTEAQQDFSYFNREAASASSEHKPYLMAPTPGKPAVVDRS